MITKSEVSEYAPFYETYIGKVEGDVLSTLQNQVQVLHEYIVENKDRLSYAYANDKWSIREVIVHIVDTEQVFAYRLLRIARGDTTPLAGFDQNIFIDNSDFDHLGQDDLLQLWNTQRAYTLSLIHTLPADSHSRSGIASGGKVSARALVYMIAGHALHHIDILKERYG